MSFRKRDSRRVLSVKVVLVIHVLLRYIIISSIEHGMSILSD